LSSTTWDVETTGHRAVDLLEEGEHISGGVALPLRHSVMTSPVEMLSAANKSVVPLRL
jgi:hypothetical protein